MNNYLDCVALTGHLLVREGVAVALQLTEEAPNVIATNTEIGEIANLMNGKKGTSLTRIPTPCGVSQ